MTKYILESGSYKNHPVKAKLFFEEALKNLGNQPKILWCFFAIPEDERASRYDDYIAQSRNFISPEIVPIHEQATVEDFKEQVNRADLVNIQGGHTKTLVESLSGYDLIELFSDKVVAGHSAGANVLGVSYWSPGMRELGDGFGILPFKFISHFNSDYGYADERGPIDWNAAKELLQEYGNTSLPVHTLEEGEFVVINK